MAMHVQSKFMNWSIQHSHHCGADANEGCTKEARSKGLHGKAVVSIIFAESKIAVGIK